MSSRFVLLRCSSGAPYTLRRSHYEWATGDCTSIAFHNWVGYNNLPNRLQDRVRMERICAATMPMPAKDIYHNAVRFALIKDGWEILTEDYTLEYGGDRLYVDIAAEKSLAAEKQGRKILVEVKSFLGRSFVNDLEQAVGQYIVYRDILVEKELDFQLYLAITKGTYQNYFQRKLTKDDYQSQSG